MIFPRNYGLVRLPLAPSRSASRNGFGRNKTAAYNSELSMTSRQKIPDGAEPLIIPEGGEPGQKDEKPADKPESPPQKQPAAGGRGRVGSVK